MKKALLIAASSLFLAAQGIAQAPKPAGGGSAPGAPPLELSKSPAQTRVAASLAQLPLAFEENRGQTDRSVKFVSRGAGYEVFFTPDEAVFALRKSPADPDCAFPKIVEKDPLCSSTSSSPHRPEFTALGLKMLGANASAEVTGLDQLPGLSNYFIGNDPAKWRTKIPNFAKVRYQNLYPGVDLVYYGNQQQLESDFVLAPGADPKQIQFEIEGATGVQVRAHDELVLQTAAGEVRLLHPEIYQMDGGTRRKVQGHYVLLSENRVGFEVTAYDPSKQLIIDPTLVYSTYLGGSSLNANVGDKGFGITIDSTGNAYITGTASSPDFPGSNLHECATNFCFGTVTTFVTKLNPSGSALVYSDLIGGTSSGNFDGGSAIALDGSLNAYVAGVTSASDFPTVNPFQATFGGATRTGFVLKLSADGSTLMYSTYLGGRNSGDTSDAFGIALDSANDAFVVGDTNSATFPTVNPMQATLNGTNSAFVGKLDPNGQPMFLTYLGGNGFDQGIGIAVDKNGNPYVSGLTSSTNFPVSATAFQKALHAGGFQNAFITKLATDGSALIYSTYLGGSNNVGSGVGDNGFSIAVDGSLNAYVTGLTDSLDFPLTPSPIQPAYGGGPFDAFITKLSTDGATLVYSTFLGGVGRDVANGIAVDAAGNAYVTGRTVSANFPLSHSLQAKPPGHSCVFVARINTAGNALDYSTLVCGTMSGGFDDGFNIAVEPTSGNAYVTGFSTSVDFPVLGPFQGSLQSSAGNAFVLKLSPTSLATVSLFPPSLSFGDVGIGSASFTEQVTLTNNTASALTSIAISFTGANALEFAQTNTCATPLAAGANCVISVTFSPTGQDTRTATLQAVTSANTPTASLSGIGDVPELLLSATSIPFGNQPLNTTGIRGLVITNTGKVPLHFGNIRGVGPNVSEFGIDKSGGNCGIVPPGGSCSVQVTFTPTVVGAASATAIIEDDAAGSPQSVSATGTGVVGQVALAPPTLNFFNQIVGIASFPNFMTLANNSGATITLTSNVVEGGANAADFAVNNANTTCTNGAKIPSGSSCVVQVTFTASAVGVRNATLTFNFTGASGSPLVGNLTGVGLSGVSVQPNPVNVGAQFVGFSGSGVGAILYNATPTPLTVTSIVVSGPNQADFTAITVTPSCAPGGVVPADSRCFLQGKFAPLDLGPRTATATLSFTGPAGSPIAITLNGTGVAGPVTLCASTQLFCFGFNFLVANFGGQIVNTTSPSQRFILTNKQKVPLHIATLAKGGTNPTQFAIAPTSTCINGLTVNPGATCVVDLAFAPTTTGALAATLTITDDGPGSPRTLTLNGTGEPAAITTSDSILDFGDRTVGVLKQRAVALINGGTSAISITANSTITGTNAADFVIDTTPGNTTCVLNAKVLGSGGTCAVTINFTPAATGARTATLTIFDNGAGNPRVVALQGNGILTPQISPSTTSINFVNQGVGTTSKPLPVTIMNTGNATLTLSSVALNGPQNPGDFAIASGTTCTNGAMVSPGANCVINVTFTPTATGFRDSSISILSDSGKNGNTQTIISLFGTGITPGVFVSPTSFDFGKVALGAPNNTSPTIIVTNDATVPVTIGTVTIGGTNAADFTFPFNGCTNASALPPNGGTCGFQVNFTPGGAGTRTGSVSITFSGASGSPLSVTLTGVGSGTLLVTPSPMAFPSTQVGTPVFLNATIQNGTASPVTINTVPNPTGTNAADFSVGNTGCGFQIVLAANGGTCQFVVGFTPTFSAAPPPTPDTRTAQIVIGTSSGSLPLNLTGTATEPFAQLSPNPLAFGTQAVNTQSAPFAVTVSDKGTVGFSITNTAITGPNADDFALAGGFTPGQCFGFVSANSSCTVSILFTPSGTGSRTATFTITDNANTPSQSITLQGTGQAGTVSLSPTALNYPTTNLGTVSESEATIFSNTSAAPVNITAIGLSGSNAGDFAVATSSTCKLNVLVSSAVGACVVNVTFSPLGGGVRSALLTVTDNKTGSHSIPLNGNGTNPIVTVSPNPLNFGNQLVGTTSGTLFVTLNNGTGSAVTITAAPSIAGGNASDFSVVTAGTTCTNGFVVAASTGSCIVNLSFKPGAAGARTTTLTITASDTGSPHNVTLNGVGTQPVVALSTNSVQFPNETLNNTSGVQSVTVTNNGTGALNISTVVKSGTNAGDFAIASGTTCTNGAVVPPAPGPGNTCVLNFTFTPTGLGARTATITITDNASPTTQVITLNGTGIAAFVTLTPSPLAFGNQRTNVASAPMTLTLTNSGGTSVTLATSSSVVIGGTNPSDFATAAGTTCADSLVLAAGNSCIINIIFTPPALGARSATVTVTDSSNPPTQTASLTGTGVFPQAVPSPSPLNFGNQSVNVTSVPLTITLNNGGTDTLHLAVANGVANGGTNASDFAILNTSTCVNGGTVLAGSSCVVNITFTPPVLGPRTAALTFTDDASPTTQVVTLNGTGVTSVVNFNSASLAFNNQRTGVTSSPMTLTLTNSGNISVTLDPTTAVSIGGANASDFTVAAGTTCVNGFVLTKAGGSCVINIIFKPGANGARSATVTVKDNSNPATQAANLTGTGVFPQAVPAPSPANFGNQPINQTSIVLSVTLNNPGTDTLHLAATNAVVKGGTNAADFTIATGTTCVNGATVAAGGSCIVNLTFTPPVVGARSATLTITDDANPTTQIVALSGNGVTAVVNLNPASLAFGNQRTGAASGAQTLTLTNSGNATVTLAASNAVALGGTNPGDFTIGAGTTCANSLVLAANPGPGNSCVINIIFTPIALGPRSATVTVTDSSNPPTQTAGLSGTGVLPQAVPSPSPLNFGVQVIGTVNTLTVTLSNPGTDTLHLAATNAVQLGGTNPGAFPIATGTTCANSTAVLPGANCIIKITFTPIASGVFTATLTITDDASPTTQAVTLNGTGTPVSLSGASLNFGAQGVGATSATHSVTLTNDGVAPLTITSITVIGANSGDFSEPNTCPMSPATLPVKATCTISVTFKPTARGKRTASLQISYNDPSSPQLVSLNGVGGTAGDFDGDGKADLAAWRPSNGTWYIVPSSNPTTFTSRQWGLQGDILVPGDYDGDGETDFAVWRSSTGTWYIVPSSNPTTFTSRQWGLQGDIPVPGDYDGDGIADFAVWRPSTGTWYIIPSGNPGTPIVKQWGLPTDLPVPGDYDGDGKTDIAAWRPSTGTWYIVPSSNPTTFTSRQWGQTGDIPVPRDYDGDRTTNIAVWRPSNGTWYVITVTSITGFTATQWGLSTDVPVQKPAGQ